MAERHPIRLERDGAVAAMVLSNPPLNLFGDDAWRRSIDCLDEVEGSDARALVWRAEGDIFTGGVDVNVFQRVVDEGGAADALRLADRRSCSGSRRCRSRPSPWSTASA